MKEAMRSRVVRIPQPLWDAAKSRSDERGETVSHAIRKFLERYVK